MPKKVNLYVAETFHIDTIKNNNKNVKQILD
jgi:hypothetical protein